MIKKSLHEFVERILDTNVISNEDVRELQNDILPDNIMYRAEADLLIALDRMVEQQCPAWGELYVSLLVDFAVWGSRPTGYVGTETAVWLATALAAGNGPTENGYRAAFEVVREAQQVDEALVTFVLQGAQAHRAHRVIAPQTNRSQNTQRATVSNNARAA